MPWHLVGLWGLAVAQPIYEMLARFPAFLSAHDMRAGRVLAFCVLLSAVLPGLIWLAASLLGRLNPAAGRLVSTAFGAGLLLLLLLPLPWRLDATLPLAAGAVGVVIVVAGLSWLLATRGPMQMLLDVLGLGVLVFPAWFLLQAPVAQKFSSTDVPRSLAPERLPTVVVVVFDELPTTALRNGTKTIDATLFPRLAALASDAVWYRQTTSVASQTELAVPALLTGRRPRQSPRGPDHTGHPESLFSLLGPHYELHVHEPVTALCSPRWCEDTGASWRQILTDTWWVFAHVAAPEPLRELLPPIDGQWASFGLGEVAPRMEAEKRAGREASFREFLNEIDATGRPTLHFFHSLLPHAPYEYTPSGQRLFRHRVLPGLSKVDGEDAWADEETLVGNAKQLFLWQLQLVDTLVGELVDRLRAKGLYEQVLLVITADHGVSFRPGDRRRVPTPGNLWDIASVPLLVKLPGQTQPVVDDDLLETIDVLPLIAAALAIEIPWQIEGGRPAIRERRSLRYGDRTLELAAATPAAALSTWWPPQALEPRLRALQIDELPACAGATAELMNEQIYGNIVPTVFVPAQIIGTLTSKAQAIANREVLVALNGAVVAVAGPGAEAAEFVAFVDEHRFALGPNRLQLVLHGKADSCVLFDNQQRPSTSGAGNPG